MALCLCPRGLLIVRPWSSYRRSIDVVFPTATLFGVAVAVCVPVLEALPVVQISGSLAISIFLEYDLVMLILRSRQ